ncbi:hypothetical protein [Xanthomonas fragariae]|uniref:hypothetical protein n=1 Tax=Xanthomonas fragariae TaxID=48664 RepID=UPI00131EE925|nr:hypothetical protein [Xanthomonas fragariae]
MDSKLRRYSKSGGRRHRRDKIQGVLLDALREHITRRIKSVLSKDHQSIAMNDLYSRPSGNYKYNNPQSDGGRIKKIVELAPRYAAQEDDSLQSHFDLNIFYYLKKDGSYTKGGDKLFSRP